mmetsp:Transcript_33565/g.50747  ORF Transcript_33565/g.50747 Transcript_33565/m.50747 type:complete len:84 (-) Transcript_33565:64-315(-)
MCCCTAKIPPRGILNSRFHLRATAALIVPVLFNKKAAVLLIISSSYRESAPFMDSAPSRGSHLKEDNIVEDVFRSRITCQGIV